MTRMNRRRPGRVRRAGRARRAGAKGKTALGALLAAMLLATAGLWALDGGAADRSAEKVVRLVPLAETESGETVAMVEQVLALYNERGGEALRPWFAGGDTDPAVWRMLGQDDPVAAGLSALEACGANVTMQQPRAFTTNEKNSPYRIVEGELAPSGRVLRFTLSRSRGVHRIASVEPAGTP